MATAGLAFPAQAGFPPAGSSTPPAHETSSGIPVPPQAPADLPALSPSGPFPRDSVAYAQGTVPTGTGAEGGAAPEAPATSTTPGAQAESGTTPGAKAESIAPLTDPLVLFSLTLPYPAIMGASIPPGAQLSPGDSSLIPSPPCTTEITARLLQMKRLPTGGTEILIQGGGNRPESSDGSEYHLRFTITDPDFGEKLREIANRHRLTALDGTDRFKPGVNTEATYLTIESGTRQIHSASNMPLLTPDCICEVFRLFRDLAQSHGHDLSPENSRTQICGDADVPWLTGNWRGQDPSQGTVLEAAIREDLAEIRENGEVIYRGGYQITRDQVLPAEIQYPIFSLEELSGDTDDSGEDSQDSGNSRIPNFQGMCKIDQETLGIIIQRPDEPPRTVGMKRTEP